MVKVREGGRVRIGVRAWVNEWLGWGSELGLGKRYYQNNSLEYVPKSVENDNNKYSVSFHNCNNRIRARWWEAVEIIGKISFEGTSPSPRHPRILTPPRTHVHTIQQNGTNLFFSVSVTSAYMYG